MGRAGRPPPPFEDDPNKPKPTPNQPQPQTNVSLARYITRYDDALVQLSSSWRRGSVFDAEDQLVARARARPESKQLHVELAMVLSRKPAPDLDGADRAFRVAVRPARAGRRRRRRLFLVSAVTHGGGEPPRLGGHARRRPDSGPARAVGGYAWWWWRLPTPRSRAAAASRPRSGSRRATATHARGTDGCCATR